MVSSADFLTNREAIVAARAALTDSAWDHLVGAAESETTARRNRAALDSIAFRPRVLVGVNDVDPSTTFLGRRLRLPVLLATIGDPEAFTADGARAVAEAATTFGSIPFVAARLDEALGASTTGPEIFELSAHDEPDRLAALAESAEEAGCVALCVSLLPEGHGRRERESIYPSPLPRRISNVWTTVASLASRSRLPLIAKGVTNADDTRLALANGCAAIYVSNYGGRALDHCQGTIDVLAEVVDAADGRAEVMIDGGFTRGTDIVKALALGARAVAIGRLQGFGLAAGGAEGLVRVLEILEDELRISLSLLGATTVDALTLDHLYRDAPLVDLPHDTSAFFRGVSSLPC